MNTDESTGEGPQEMFRKVRNLSVIVIAVGLVPLFGLLRAGNQLSPPVHFGIITTLVFTILLFGAFALEPRLILHRAAYRDYDER